MYPIIVRTLISILLVTLAVLSLLGIAWWDQPPEALVGYTLGGKLILGVLVAASAFGVLILWRQPRAKAGKK